MPCVAKVALSEHQLVTLNCKAAFLSSPCPHIDPHTSFCTRLSVRGRNRGVLVVSRFLFPLGCFMDETEKYVLYFSIIRTLSNIASCCSFLSRETSADTTTYTTTNLSHQVHSKNYDSSLSIYVNRKIYALHRLIVWLGNGHLRTEYCRTKGSRDCLLELRHLALKSFTRLREASGGGKRSEVDSLHDVASAAVVCHRTTRYADIRASGHVFFLLRWHP